MDLKITSFPLRYKAMMQGNIIDFPEGDVIDILTHLDYYHINTLMIQTNSNKSTNATQWFTCKVDEPTVRAYIKEQESEMRII